MLGRFVSAVAVAAAVVLVGVAPASAHIDPDPEQAQAGARLSVAFTVEHGCAGSPTTQLDMRLPIGVIDAVPEPVDGWDGSVDTVDGDTIVTFAGGSLADDVEGTFAVTMTLPTTPDATIYFPFVQRCDVGEIRWIGVPSEPGQELDEPAPAMNLTGPVATVPPDVTVPGSTEPEITTPSTTDAPAISETSTATTERPPPTSVVDSTAAPVATSESAGDTSGSNTGTIAFIITIAVVFGLGAFVAFRARQARAANPG
jgi:uncharacterized protein YcnI